MIEGVLYFNGGYSGSKSIEQLQGSKVQGSKVQGFYTTRFWILAKGTEAVIIDKQPAARNH